jgi:hypothetical protein
VKVVGRLLLLLGAPASALTGACVDLNTNNVQPTTWSGTLVPGSLYPGLTGQVAAVVNATETDVGIGLDGATPGAQHVWALRFGSCSTPGQQMGEDLDYPVLAVSDSGKASAETALGTRLARDGSYAVLVRRGTTDTARVACGDLIRS